MQLRNVGTPLLILTVALGFTLWGCWQRHPFWHIRDLYQCACTYFRFPRLHLNHFIYPTKMPEALHGCISPSYHFAPKIIHQILLNEHHFHDDDGPTRFAKYESARNSCIALHPDWEYKFWTDENATDWVYEHYPNKKYPFDDTPEVYQPYIKYRQTIQRTNILRYLLLHHYGGVYLDVDIECRENLDPLLRVPFLTPAAHPAGINNAFILARPGHPFLTKLIEQIPKHNLTWMGMPYVENMLSTGCMFISNEWVKYMRGSPRRCEDEVYILAGEHNDTTSHMLRGKVRTTLFYHGGESSWHQKDARIMFWLDKHWREVLAGAFIFLFVSAAVLAFLYCWKRPCWLGGRCRDRSRCKYGKEKPKKGDVEYSGGSAGHLDGHGDPSPPASNVAVHSSSRQESDAPAGVQPAASDATAPSSIWRGSDARSIAESVASDATIRPANGRNTVVAKR